MTNTITRRDNQNTVSLNSKRYSYCITDIDLLCLANFGVKRNKKRTIAVGKEGAFPGRPTEGNGGWHQAPFWFLYAKIFVALPDRHIHPATLLQKFFDHTFGGKSFVHN